jgi:hypothetical protein
MISSYHEPGYFWFRILGYGLHFKDTRRHALLFSERNNIGRSLSVFGWRISGLKP